MSDRSRRTDETAQASFAAEPGQHEALTPEAMTRRRFLGTTATAAMGAAVLAACDGDQRDAFFQSHFRQLDEEDIKAVIARHERDAQRRFKRSIQISHQPALEGVEFAYGLDLSRCVGCRRCAHACQKENNCSRDPEIQWIRVLQMDKSKGIDVMEADHFYDPEEVPVEGKFYMPVACHQCRNPPCVKVCPVGATWAEPDGITVIDYDWCIGCRYCMAACPYGARHFNWKEGSVPAEELNPVTHFLGNRPRPTGVVEKCTFCIQRTRAGRYPACVEICPVGARKFGNILDPKSEIRYLLEHKRVFVFKEELMTKPRFYYFFGLA